MTRSIRRAQWARFAACFFSLSSSLAYASGNCTGLGQAQDFNALVFGNFSAQSSDVEGRIAVGGNLSINHYSLADKLTAANAGTSVLVGGNFSFPSGRIYFGNTLVAGSAGAVGAPVRNGLSAAQSIRDGVTLPIDFVAEKSRQLALSATLAALPANGTYVSQWGGLTLTGAPDAALQVFDLPGQLVLDAHTFAVQGIPAGATVIFNVRGSATGLTNMSLESLASIRRRVLFNFPDATTLTLAGISVEGSVLAPKAVIENPQGVIKGQLIAQSWNGMMQLNHEPFEGCLSAASSNPPPTITSTPELFATIGRQYRYNVTAVDAEAEIIRYGLVSGPTGAAIDAVSGLLTWTAVAANLGTHAVTVSATDSAGGSVQQTFTLRVVQGFCPIYPIALPSSVMDGKLPGAVITQMPRGTGPGNFGFLTWAGSNSAPTLATSLLPPGDSYTYTNPDAPTDRVLNIADWAQGAPGSMNAADVRSALDALKARDIILPVWNSQRGQGSNLDYRVQRFASVRLSNYSLTGNGWLSFTYKGEARCYNAAPIASAQTLVVDEDASLPITLSATDAEGDALIWTVTAVPTHGVLSGTAPALSYTPAANFNGSDTLSFRVNDGHEDSLPATISITVRPINDAPSASAQSVTTAEDSAVQITLVGSDIDTATLAFAVVDPPSHGTLSGSGVTRTYTPDANYHGPDQFTFRANDGALDSTAAVVSLTVTPVNDAPSAIAQTVTTAEDSSVAITLVGSDVEHATLTFTVIDPPSHGTLTGNGASVSYTPSPDYVGPDQFTFRANDGALNSTAAAVSLTVTPVNDAPNASAQAVTTAEDSSVAITLVGSDVDNTTLTFTVIDLPDHGTLTGTGATLSYVPDPNYHGPDQFTFKANDGALDSARASVSLTITAVNDAPTANAQSLQTEQAVPLPITLTGSDTEGDALTFVVTTPPTRGTLSGSAPNFIYTANAGAEGTDSLSFVANDGGLSSAAATVSILVTRSNREPQITSTAVTQASVGVAYRYDVDASDPDGDALTFRLDGAPLAMTIDSATGEITWTPAAADIGEQPVAVIVEDPRGGSNRQSFVVRVQAAVANRAPVADSQVITTASGAGIDLILVANDADGNPLSYRIVAAPVHGQLLGTPPAVRYQPNTNFVGVDQIRFAASDGALESAVATVQIQVGGNGNRPPRITSQPSTRIVLDASLGSAVRQNLSTWEFQDLDAFGHGTWTFLDQGFTAYHPSNGNSIGLVSPEVYHSFHMEGTWRTTDGDDDYFGMVFGYQNPYQHYLLTWKAAAQGRLKRGLSFWRANQAADGSQGYLINNAAYVSVQPLYEGDEPWIRGRTFQYTVDVLPGVARIAIKDGARLVDAFTIRDATFASGRVGIFNQSQGQTFYTAKVAPHLVSDGVYWYDVVAADPDGDAITYRLLNAPAGMWINPSTGTIRWETTAALAGSYPITVEARDPQGAATQQRYELIVAADGPVIISTPITDATAGQSYRYLVAAFDPSANETLTYSLPSAPTGMSIDPGTGDITWTPDASRLGTHAVVVKVTDAGGLSATQSYSLLVSAQVANTAPVFTSQPPLIAQVGRLYTYAPQASDADGDSVQVGFPVTVPYDMQLFDGANVTWIPAADQVGRHRI
ncbi:MAG: Ig-like domain-containing protein, partial [Pseudomarimonas sp.]